MDAIDQKSTEMDRMMPVGELLVIQQHGAYSDTEVHGPFALKVECSRTDLISAYRAQWEMDPLLRMGMNPDHVRADLFIGWLLTTERIECVSHTRWDVSDADEGALW